MHAKEHAIVSEVSPAAALKPGGEPSQRDEARQKTPDHPQEPRKEGAAEGSPNRPVHNRPLQQPAELNHDHRGSQHHRQRKTEILGQVAPDPAKQRGGNGGAGAGKTSEWKAQSLDCADQDGLSQAQRGMLRALLPHTPATMMRIPAVINAAAISGRFRKSSSTSAWAYPSILSKITRSITSFNPTPKTPVRAVATTIIPRKFMAPDPPLASPGNNSRCHRRQK